MLLSIVYLFHQSIKQKWKDRRDIGKRARAGLTQFFRPLRRWLAGLAGGVNTKTVKVGAILDAGKSAEPVIAGVIR